MHTEGRASSVRLEPKEPRTRAFIEPCFARKHWTPHKSPPGVYPQRVCETENSDGVAVRLAQRLEYVAVTVSSRDGLQIRDSPFADKIQFVMIALQQNGLAFRWISDRLQSHIGVAMVAVRQNRLALA